MATIPTFSEPDDELENPEFDDFNDNDIIVPNIPIQNDSIEDIPIENNFIEDIPIQNDSIENNSIEDTQIQEDIPTQNILIENIFNNNFPIQNIPIQNNNFRRTGLDLSPGDLIRVTIPGIGGEEFSGEYEVNLYGYLEIPFIEPLYVIGLDAQEVKNQLKDILLEKQFFRPELFRISVQVLQFSPITITVAGEVFAPGRITINTEPINALPSTPGDNPLDRYLTTALKNVGGIKPTADIEKIQIMRNGELYQEVNFSGIFKGEPIEDIPLIAGDYIIVPKTEKFQSSLVRPSPITPDQISLYVSNLTDPGSGRSVSISAETQNTSFQYGTRFSQALISAQCIGGNIRNENRRVVLIRTNLQTGQSFAQEYSIKDILGQASVTQEGTNPFVMPNDSIVCYDSDLVDAANIFELIGTFLNPLTIIDGLFNIFGGD